MPASDNVFNIPELFEFMLEHTDPKTLLLAQRVNSTWRKHICSSLVLRRILFYAVEPQTDLLLLGRYLNVVFRLPQRDLTAKMPATTKQAAIANLAPADTEIITPVRFNPLLLKSDPSPSRHYNVYFRGPDPNLAYILRWDLITGAPLISGTRESWEDMYLTQPPCKEVTASMIIDLKRRPGSDLLRRAQDRHVEHSRLTIKQAKGVTLKQVLDAGLQGLDVNKMKAVHVIRIQFHNVMEPRGNETTKAEWAQRVVTISKNRKTLPKAD